MVGQHDITELPFLFTHLVPSNDLHNRAKALEAQGFRPGLDWIDLLDYAEEEVLEELRSMAEALNLQEHKIEHDWDTLNVDVMTIHCSFKHEPDMVTFKAFLT